MRKLDLDSMRWDLPPPRDAVSHHVHHHVLSRRAFMGSMAAVAGATVGAGLLPATVLAKTGSSAPKPTTSQVTLGGLTFSLAFFGPGIDPSSITDFNGFVGVADVRGTGTATNPDQSTETLIFDTDMRFMSGVYVGVDGAVHKGAFGFVWLDLYRGSVDPNNQVHDFDPGITPYPDGLFWTVPNPTVDSINLGLGTAHMQMKDLALQDFFNIPNALFHLQDPVSSPANCSFDIHWSGPVTNRGQVTNSPGSTGELIMSSATMTWSASNAQGFSFVSDPSGTSSFFAQLGHVSNGVFAE